MVDREKVVDGLQEAAAYFRSSFDAMYGTVACEKFRGWTDAIEQAIVLLKAHVIQFNEIDDYEVLWLEIRDVESEEGLAPWVKTRSGHWFSPLLCSTLEPDMILSEPEEYGVYCRCWTSRPTEEQMEAEPWE